MRVEFYGKISDLLSTSVLVYNTLQIHIVVSINFRELLVIVVNFLSTYPILFEELCATITQELREACTICTIQHRHSAHSIL